MKADITVRVRRPDGTTLIREVSLETGVTWSGIGGLTRETRQAFRKRLDRTLVAALNATVGGR